jgi:hypothetical protein
VVQPSAEVVVVKNVRAAVVEAGQFVDEADVAVDGALGLVMKREVLDESLA